MGVAAGYVITSADAVHCGARIHVGHPAGAHA